MADQQFKRNVAYKLRIGDILAGKPIIEGERFSFLELGDKKIVRVNVVGNVIEKFENETEKTKYVFINIDDGSGQLRLKAFGAEDVEKYSDINQGDTIVVIGVLRSFNNETYIAPEIIKKYDPRYLLVRKLEIEKERSKDVIQVGKEQITAVKDRILENIKNSEPEGGIEMDKLIMELRDISPEIIKQEIQKLLEEGIAFEPYPGKVRYLG